jgi:gamma-butyrobetaine dioxygenase/trimethyllysine dioxygenase
MPTSTPAVAVHDRWLRVSFADGHHADFHHRWLRHNCDVDRHPTTRERIVDSSELPDDLRAADARIDGDALVVVWSHDQRASRYALGWLAEHAYARDRPTTPPPAAEIAHITVQAAAGATAAARIDAALALLDRHGAALVRRHPSATTPAEDETEALIDAIGARGLHVIGTHFGRIEDLRTDNTTNTNTDQLGYTDAPVALHTDQPFLDAPPRYQLLQSIRVATVGGENQLVDAHAALAYLAQHDARAAQLLRTVPGRFHRRQAKFERIVDSPLFSDGPTGPIVRYSYFTMAPHQRPFAEMEEWYRAYDTFARIVRDPRHQLIALLQPGDFVIYDNHRMLHARSGFSGPRWVRGVYFDR